MTGSADAVNGGIVVLQHQDDDGPANLASWLADNGEPYLLVDVTTGVLPNSGRYGALVVLGSTESVYDPGVPWLPAEMSFVRECIEAGTPVFEICFGAELLARVLGGDVTRMDLPEIGWYDVAETVPYSGSWFMWHGDQLSAPPGSRVLARTDRCVHAFVHGDHVGVQYHPEMTAAHIYHWLEMPERRAKIAAAGHDAEQIEAETPYRATDAEIGATKLYESFFQSIRSSSGVAQ